ncbi:MAG: 4Fe-4S dicluster domain-containing protein, partial [Bacillota bacterium]|nr:4Fe-4S dicluster domain-containing protein [Bacillota bacterium]
SCDCSGLQCLDKVFLTRGFEDPYYRGRRENSLIFSLACNGSKDTCFCQSMGGDPQKAQGADVQMYENEIAYFFVPVSEKGEAFMADHSGLFEDMEDFTPIPFTQMLSVDMEGVSEKAEKMFDDPLWTKISRACIGCSTCAYLCPTCYCFDIIDRRHGESGVKFRTWDCCMFDDYSKMAGGHNPRPSQKERVRNRMLDKLVYNKKRHGRGFCVGCGRCIAKCPVNIDITAVIKKIKEAEGYEC